MNENRDLDRHRLHSDRLAGPALPPGGTPAPTFARHWPLFWACALAGALLGWQPSYLHEFGHFLAAEATGHRATILSATRTLWYGTDDHDLIVAAGPMAELFVAALLVWWMLARERLHGRAQNWALGAAGGWLAAVAVKPWYWALQYSTGTAEFSMAPDLLRLSGPALSVVLLVQAGVGVCLLALADAARDRRGTP